MAAGVRMHRCHPAGHTHAQVHPDVTQIGPKARPVTGLTLVPAHTAWISASASRTTSLTCSKCLSSSSMMPSSWIFSTLYSSLLRFRTCTQRATSAASGAQMLHGAAYSMQLVVQPWMAHTGGMHMLSE